MESEVFKGRHSITASCSPLMSDSRSESSSNEDEAEAKPIRKLFQAKVQKLLAVRWFTQTRGMRFRHLRKGSSSYTDAPSQEEEVLLGKILSNRHLMQKTMEMLQSFQREVSGVDGFFDELGVQPSWVPGQLERVEEGMLDDKKESLMNLAVKAIHEAKWISLRIFYNDHMKQQEQELKVLKQNYEKLRKQFAEVRQDYLQEVATLRDQVRIRGDVDTTGWKDETGGDVVYFFDPAKTLTEKEADFVLNAVKEKLLMILEQNPRIGGAVDLGQLEKLKDLKENKELENLKAELLKRSYELVDAQKQLRKLQEEQELEQAQAQESPPGARNKHRFERMLVELEDKVTQLRHDAANLKRQLYVESKDRHRAEQSLEELRAEHEELRQSSEDLEEQHGLCQSEVRALRNELDYAQTRTLELQESEEALKAQMESLQQSRDELLQVIQRQARWEQQPIDPMDPFDPMTAMGTGSAPDDLRCSGSGDTRRQTSGISSGSFPEKAEEAPINAQATVETIANGPGTKQQSFDSLLEEAHQQVIQALETKDLNVSRCEELRRENAMLRRDLARQSRGVLMMEAQSSSQSASDLSNFLSSLQNQLGASPRTSSKAKAGSGTNLSFPELEKRLADATAQASTSLQAVLQALRKRKQIEAHDLQLLQQESLRSQREKHELEKELFELRLSHLSKGLAAGTRNKADDEKVQSLLACSLGFLESMSQTVQQLASENTTLRESLLSFSSSLSQASSMVSAKGNPELASILSSITANAECAVPAVFNRLFHDSRKLDPRLELEARERRESLMKSLIYHLSEERPVDQRISLRQTHTAVFDTEETPATARPRLLRQRSTREDLEETPATARPRLLRQRSTREDLEETPVTARPPRLLQQRPSLEDLEEPPASHRPFHRPVKQKSSAEDSVAVPARPLVDDDGFEDALFNPSRNSWSRQCSGSSEVSNSSSRVNSRRAYLGITSLEFHPSTDANGPLRAERKLRVPGSRKPEGLMLPQVPLQAHPHSAELQSFSSRYAADLRADSEEVSENEELSASAQERPPLPQVAVKPPEDTQHFPVRMDPVSDRRLSTTDVKPPESWPSRMKNALTGRRLSHLVVRPEPTRGRRSSFS